MYVKPPSRTRQVSLFASFCLPPNKHTGHFKPSLSDHVNYFMQNTQFSENCIIIYSTQMYESGFKNFKKCRKMRFKQETGSQIQKSILL